MYRHNPFPKGMEPHRLSCALNAFSAQGNLQQCIRSKCNLRDPCKSICTAAQFSNRRRGTNTPSEAEITVLTYKHTLQTKLTVVYVFGMRCGMIQCQKSQQSLEQSNSYIVSCSLTPFRIFLGALSYLPLVVLRDTDCQHGFA